MKSNRSRLLIGILVAIMAALAVWLVVANGSLPAVLAGEPNVAILQPSGPASRSSGETLFVVVQGDSPIGISRFQLLEGGSAIAEYAVPSTDKQAFAIFAWDASSVGDFELSVVAYDARGAASQPAGLQVSVSPADVAAAIEGADFANDSHGAVDLVSDPSDAEGAGGQAAAGEQGEAAAGEDAAAEQEQPQAPEGEPPAQEPVEEPELPPQEEIAADNQAPTATLQVDVHRAGEALVAEIRGHGSDDVGLDFLRLSISGPGGQNEVLVWPCAAALECDLNHRYALGAEGEWVFHLQAFDLVPQVSDAAMTSRQILCQDQNGARVCSVVERNEFLAQLLEQILRNREANWEQLVNGDLLNLDDIVIDFALGEAEQQAAEDESFELRGCFIVQPVHPNNPPAPPVTDCPEANLSAEDLSGLDLRGANFERADLRQANLSDAQLNFARLFGTDLRGANLQNAVIARSESRLGLFTGADLTAAFGYYGAFSGASMQNIVAPQSDFNHAFFIETDLSGADLRASYLDGANFQNANLSGANLSGASLVGANLQGAVMPGINLQSADLTNANMFRAQLRFPNGNPDLFLLHGAQYSNTICPDGTNSDDNGGTCTGSNLAPYVIGGCIIVVNNQYPDPPFSDCSGLDMTGANFEGRDLRGADFSGTTLIGADMRDGDFRFADFTNANLLAARASQAVYGGATWSNTTCPDSSNSDANGGTCDGHMFP